MQVVVHGERETGAMGDGGAWRAEADGVRGERLEQMGQLPDGGLE